MNHESDATIERVLRCWEIDNAAIEASPSQLHGFSGVRVWRIRSGNARFALRRLTKLLAEAEHATKTHQLMRYAGRALDFLPWPRSTADGKTIAFSEGAFWSLETWLPGAPVDVVDRPHIEMAATALWMLHEVTQDSQCFGDFQEEALCAAIKRRRVALKGWLGGLTQAEPLPQQKRIRNLLADAVPAAQTLVAGCEDMTVRRQPVLGDLRKQDVLFTNGRVTGLVDFGAATIDSPLVDLTRLLGELAGEDETLWRAGLDAYQLRRQLGHEALQLVPALDAGGVVGACINWLRWLAEGTVVPSEAVADRLDHLITRLEPIAAGNLVAQRALAG